MSRKPPGVKYAGELPVLVPFVKLVRTAAILFIVCVVRARALQGEGGDAACSARVFGLDG